MRSCASGWRANRGERDCRDVRPPAGFVPCGSALGPFPERLRMTTRNARSVATACVRSPLS
jgi:hypothetical protein